MVGGVLNGSEYEIEEFWLNSYNSIAYQGGNRFPLRKEVNHHLNVEIPNHLLHAPNVEARGYETTTRKGSLHALPLPGKHTHHDIIPTIRAREV